MRHVGRAELLTRDRPQPEPGAANPQRALRVSGLEDAAQDPPEPAVCLLAALTAQERTGATPGRLEVTQDAQGLVEPPHRKMAPS